MGHILNLGFGHAIALRVDLKNVIRGEHRAIGGGETRGARLTRGNAGESFDLNHDRHALRKRSASTMPSVKTDELLRGCFRDVGCLLDRLALTDRDLGLDDRGVPCLGQVAPVPGLADVLLGVDHGRPYAASGFARDECCEITICEPQVLSLGTRNRLNRHLTPRGIRTVEV